MRKKILLIEKSDSIRGMAETLLRQNGFEVISLTDPQKGLEVVSFARPDLLIAGADSTFPNGDTLVDRVRQDASLSDIPALLVVDEGERNSSLPEEMHLTRPLEPSQFMARVKMFSGDSTAAAPPAQQGPNPFKEASLDDDFLDAALGLDGLEVVDSEVMDKTTHSKSTRDQTGGERLIGMEHNGEKPNGPSDSRRVESVMIHEDATDIVQKPAAPGKVKPLSETGSLDILSDQYGITDPAGASSGPSDQAHDYDWFINEMQTDSNPAPKGASDSGSFSLTDNSSIVDPITPAPATTEVKKMSQTGGGVEKFIDEFKKEIEKFETEQSEQIIAEEPAAESNSTPDEGPSWEDSIENVSTEQVALFTRQLAYDLAEKIARMIIDKIDEGKLLEMIKSEIIARAKSKKN